MWIMLVVWGVPMIGNPPVILPQKYQTEEACQRAGISLVKTSIPTNFMCLEERELPKQEPRKP